MKAVTYILRCSNGQYYVGSTENLEERMKLHNSGKGGQFTSRHLPFELVYTEEFDSYAEAFRRERQLHGWSHAKKEALITHHPSSFSGLYWFLYLDELGNRLSKDYPNKVVHVAENIQPSARGEYEITTGTHDSLSEASTFVEVIENRWSSESRDKCT